MQHLMLDLAKAHQAQLRAEAASEHLARASRHSTDSSLDSTRIRRLVDAIRSRFAGFGGQGSLGRAATA